MSNRNDEMIERAKAAASAEELLAMARENGVEMSEESAKAYFEQLHRSGELSDDELDDVSGGGCYSGGRLVVTNMHSCDLWACEDCGSSNWSYKHVTDQYERVHRCGGVNHGVICGNCKYMIYNGLQLCNHPDKRR